MKLHEIHVDCFAAVMSASLPIILIISAFITRTDLFQCRPLTVLQTLFPAPVIEFVVTSDVALSYSALVFSANFVVNLSKK